MQWSALRPRGFVRVRFLDHCEMWADDGSEAPANFDHSVDDGEVLEVEVRGQIARVTPDSLEVEGCWETSAEVCFGTYRIVRSAVLAIEPLLPWTPTR